MHRIVQLTLFILSILLCGTAGSLYTSAYEVQKNVDVD